jgi:hypothetical protein
MINAASLLMLPHVELAGITRPADRLCHAKQLQPIAQLHVTAPVSLHRGARAFRLGIARDRLETKRERRHASRGEIRLADHFTGRRERLRFHA